VSFISRYIRSASEGQEHTTMAVVVLILDTDVEVMVMHHSQLVFLVDEAASSCLKPIIVFE
jgi:hypothetical protein